MTICAAILFVMGLLGGADILFFHMRAHRLRQHRPARAELVTHSLRGPTYTLLFALVPNFEFRGAWFYVLLGLLAFDLAISIADFWLERDSRSALGGLSRGEYLLHVLLAMLFGALVLAVWSTGAAQRGEVTELRWIHDGPPILLRLALALMTPLVLASGIADALAVRRMSRRSA